MEATATSGKQKKKANSHPTHGAPQDDIGSDVEEADDCVNDSETSSARSDETAGPPAEASASTAPLESGGAEAREDVHPPPPPPPPVPGDGCALDDAVEDEVSEDVHDIIVDDATLPAMRGNQVVDPVSGEVLGRVNVLRKYSKSEAVTVYCRLHQCYPAPRRSSQAPSQISLMMWFRMGLRDLPQGKAGQAEHLEQFRNMCRG